VASLTGPPQRCLGEVACTVGAGCRRCDGNPEHVSDMSVLGGGGSPLRDLDGVIGVLGGFVHTV